MKKSEIRAREAEVTTLRRLLEYARAHYSDSPASEMLDSDQKYNYTELVAAIDRMSETMSTNGIGAGAKVAIFSQNMPNWTVAFMAATAYGRVAVPILAESSAVEVANILEHSETKALFVSKAKKAVLPQELLDSLDFVVELDSLELIRGKEGVEYAETSIPEPNDLAGLFYTSGTTGRAKGVMLSHGNLCQNIHAAWHTAPFVATDRWLSILPMAHTYEMAFSLLYPFFLGASVYYIMKAPTTSVLTDALARVKPQVVCSVPLIIDKIYRSSARKAIERSKTLSWMEKHMKNVLYFIIGRKIKAFFGGQLKFFGIGGAKLDPVVEDFLIRAKFPYAIGYGLTETAPLICAKRVGKKHCGALGPNAYKIDVRLGDVNPETGEGEIQCKGPNVMLGYYKDPEKTASVFTEDGWFRTGDLASVDKDGFYYIKGRIGTMIVGPSGENIYPEEIESVINGYGGVSESVVVNRGGRLVALVKFDESVINWDFEKEENFYAMIEQKKKALQEFVNKNVRKSNNINDVEIVKQPFIKTATLKIRRFLYEKTNTPEKK